MYHGFEDENTRRPWDNRPNVHPGPLLKISGDEVEAIFNAPPLSKEIATYVLAKSVSIIEDFQEPRHLD